LGEFEVCAFVSSLFLTNIFLIEELVELVKEKTSNRLESAVRISTFRLLLYFPLEYFSFQVLSGFVGCAVEVDGVLVKATEREEKDVMKDLVVLRMFLKRVCVFVGGGGALDFRVGCLF